MATTLSGAEWRRVAFLRREDPLNDDTAQLRCRHGGTFSGNGARDGQFS